MASKRRILIVDDEKDIRFLLREILEDEGYDVSEAPHSEAAYSDIATRGMPDLVILDIWLENSDRDGMEILGDLKRRSKTLPVIMISGHGNIEMAVKAIKLGAYDFIEKPFNTDRLLNLLSRAFEQGQKRKTSNQIAPVANSTEMQAAVKLAQKAALGDARITVTGPWGAGRTYMARYLHQESSRATKPCIVLSAGAVDSHTLLEAMSGEGSVILQDIQLLPGALQTELLNRLHSKTEARLIATATPALEAMKDVGTFSPDLYERICVTRIAMPGLSERRADLPDLCAALITDYFESWGVTGTVKLSTDAQAYMQQTAFSGQVFELKVLCALAAMRMVEAKVSEATAAYFVTGGVQPPVLATAASGPQEWLQTDLRQAREAFEKWYFDNLMDRFEGNVSQVAAFAGMDRTALYRKLKSFKEGGSEDIEAA